MKFLRFYLKVSRLMRNVYINIARLRAEIICFVHHKFFKLGTVIGIDS